MSLQLPSGVSLGDIPAESPPAGVHSDFAHPSSTLQPTVIGVTVTFMVIGLALATVSLFQRRRDLHTTDCSSMYTTFYISAGLKVDRFTDLRTFACSLTVAYSSLIISISSGDVHGWDLSLAHLNAPHWTRTIFVTDLLTVASIFTAKCAILSLYMQIFQIHQPLRQDPVRIACYVGFLINVCAYLPSFITAFVYGIPHGKEHWGLAVAANESKDIPLGIQRSVVSTLLDFYLFILPIPPVVRLKMSRRRKLAVLAVFSTALLGVFSCLCSLGFIIKAQVSPDGSWYGTIVQLCYVIEVWIAIIVASMPGCAAAWRVNIIDSGFSRQVSTAFSTFSRNCSRVFGSVGSLSGSRREDGTKCSDSDDSGMGCERRRDDVVYPAEASPKGGAGISKGTEITQMEERV